MNTKKFKVTRIEKSVTPARTTIDLSIDDVAEALRLHLKACGVEVPNGNTFIWGIDHSRIHQGLTLVVDEEIAHG